MEESEQYKPLVAFVVVDAIVIALVGLYHYNVFGWK